MSTSVFSRWQIHEKPEKHNKCRRFFFFFFFEDPPFLFNNTNISPRDDTNPRSVPNWKHKGCCKTIKHFTKNNNNKTKQIKFRRNKYISEEIFFLHPSLIVEKQIQNDSLFIYKALYRIKAAF